MSPRVAKKVKKVVEVQVETEVTPRDFVMARLLAARAHAQSAIDAIDDATNLFLAPEEDESGSERKELVEAALEGVGSATRALEAADAILSDVDTAECEPWDEDADEDDTDDEEEDD